MSLQEVLEGFLGAKAKTTVKPTAIYPTYTEAQKKAFTTASNVKQTAWRMQSVPMQNLLTNIRTAVTVKAIKNQGISFVPTDTLTETQKTIDTQRQAIDTLTETLGQQTEAQADYYQRINTAMEELKAGTVLSAVRTAQLGHTTEAYTELVDNPKTVSEGMDWKGLIILGAVAIGGVLVLKMVLEKK